MSIAIVKDQTSARFGTGSAVTISGSASITAKEEMHASLESDAEAGGKNVAIGAAVAVNVVTTITTADLVRSLTATGGGITVGATTDAASEAVAKSSAKGESDSGKKGDDQSKDQVQNNPNTQNKTDGDLPKSQGLDRHGQLAVDQQVGRELRRCRHRRLGLGQLGAAHEHRERRRRA